MITFLIGIIGVIVVAFISLFVPSFYSYSWGSANFEGIIGDAAVSKTSKAYYSLVESLGGYAYLIFGVTFVGLFLYTILMLSKKSNLVPLPLIFILAIFPVINMFIGIIRSKTDGEFIRVGTLVIGAGKDAGLSEGGFICLVLLVLFYCIIAKGFALVRAQIKKEGAKEAKKLKVKANKLKSKIDDDFKL